MVLVRPQLEYASVVWDPYTQANQDELEMVQRRAARFVFNNYSRDASVSEMITGSLNGEASYSDERTAGLLWCTRSSMVTPQSTSLRNSPLLRDTQDIPILTVSFFLLRARPTFRTVFLPRTIRQWNRLPVDVATAATPASFIPEWRVCANALNNLTLSWHRPHKPRREGVVVTW